MNEPSTETVDRVAPIVMDHIDAVHLLTDDLEPGPKRDALMEVITAAYGVGYEAGIRKGAKEMANAIIERAGR